MKIARIPKQSCGLVDLELHDTANGLNLLKRHRKALGGIFKGWEGNSAQPHFALFFESITGFYGIAWYVNCANDRICQVCGAAFSQSCFITEL